MSVLSHLKTFVWSPVLPWGQQRGEAGRTHGDRRGRLLLGGAAWSDLPRAEAIGAVLGSEFSCVPRINLSAFYRKAMSSLVPSSLHGVSLTARQPRMWRRPSRCLNTQGKFPLPSWRPGRVMLLDRSPFLRPDPCATGCSCSWGAARARVSVPGVVLCLAGTEPLLRCVYFKKGCGTPKQPAGGAERSPRCLRDSGFN